MLRDTWIWAGVQGSLILLRISVYILLKWQIKPHLDAGNIDKPAVKNIHCLSPRDPFLFFSFQLHPLHTPVTQEARHQSTDTKDEMTKTDKEHLTTSNSAVPET